MHLKCSPATFPSHPAFAPSVAVAIPFRECCKLSRLSLTSDCVGLAICSEDCIAFRQTRKMKRKQAEASTSSSELDTEDEESVSSSGSEEDTSSSEAESSGASDTGGTSEVDEQPTAAKQQMHYHSSGTAAAQHSGAAQPDVPARSAPTLPWMRVPIAIEGGASVPLADVRGLHPQLAIALRSGRCPG